MHERNHSHRVTFNVSDRWPEKLSCG